MSTIMFRTNDGVVYTVPTQVANHFNLIKEMFENLEGIDDNNDDLILMTKVDSKILQRVLQYCTYHKDDVFIDEDEKTSKKRTDDISEWDQEFLDELDEPLLLNLLLAADYLDIKGLSTICCKQVAKMVKGKSADEICSMFYISKDFSGERNITNQQRK